MINYKEKLKNIKAIILDVDGVLTDGSVLLMPDGSMSRTMNVKDGYAIQFAIKQGIIVGAITGGNDAQVKHRLEYLGLTDIYLQSHHKLEDYEDIKFKYNLKDYEILYVGDDLPDLPVLQKCGLSVCPNDAVAEVKNSVDYVSPKNGGKGCVRDIIEQFMKILKLWQDNFDIRSV